MIVTFHPIGGGAPEDDSTIPIEVGKLESEVEHLEEQAEETELAIESLEVQDVNRYQEHENRMAHLEDELNAFITAQVAEEIEEEEIEEDEGNATDNGEPARREESTEREPEKPDEGPQTSHAFFRKLW